jgi:hypothetical protein
MPSTAIDEFLVEPVEPALHDIMREAFDRACDSTKEMNHPRLAREVMASRILRLARAGERDIATLCEEAVKSLGLPSKCHGAAA